MIQKVKQQRIKNDDLETTKMSKNIIQQKLQAKIERGLNAK